MKIIIYTFDDCPFCERAKSLLKSHSLGFDEVHVDRDDDKARNELLAKTGMKTFPQIFFGEKLVGGYTDLQDLDRRVGLKKAATAGF